MSKRSDFKQISAHYKVSKAGNGDLRIYVGEEVYDLVYMKVQKSHLITFNSKVIVEVANGYVNGIRYVKKSSNLLELTDLKNGIILFSSKPYKTLMFLNESDIKDVSDMNQIHGYTICYGIDEVMNYLERL